MALPAPLHLVCVMCCVLRSVSPATEPPRNEVIVLDSRSSMRLFKQNAKWAAGRFALESNSSHLVYQSCPLDTDLQGQSQVLWSDWIHLGNTRRHLFLDLNFALSSCPSPEGCEESFGAYLFEADEDYPQASPRRSSRFAIRGERRFPKEYLEGPIDWAGLRATLNAVAGLRLGAVGRSGFQLGFDYVGPCLFLGSFRVYYKKCPAGRRGLASFPEVAGGAEPVHGHCVPDAVQEGSLQRRCGMVGAWETPVGRCFCREGHQARGEACEACQIGYYKNTTGPAACTRCPKNSHSEVEGSVSCPCLRGHNRTETRLLSAACVAIEIEKPFHTTRSFAPAEGDSGMWTGAMLATIGGALLAGVLVIGLVVCLRMKTADKCKTGNRSPLVPLNTGRRYRKKAEDVRLQHLGISDSLKLSLEKLMVDRSFLSLGQSLGAGEFGSVYQGLLKQTNGFDQNVAVKTMKQGLVSNPELESFLREAELMQGFNHPNVLRLIGVSFEVCPEGQVPMPMVILPFMPHGDLRRFLLNSRHRKNAVRVSLQILLQFMSDIACGMEYLNNRGFLHRDLAARNCMLCENLRVRVADFGLSRKIYSSNYYRQTAVSRMPVKWMALESMAELVFSTKSDVSGVRSQKRL
uniref:ephrin type-A receptor 5-like isoform X2 n=1 Tax=Pristiophorus japonicus TaxID=55135 RepID=UPI00398F878F